MQAEVTASFQHIVVHLNPGRPPTPLCQALLIKPAFTCTQKEVWFMTVPLSVIIKSSSGPFK